MVVGLTHDTIIMTTESRAPPFLAALISGGLAGTSVDFALFPLDTIKTRLQSSAGFIKSGGFSGIYRGLSAAAVGSAPGAALFFSTYEMMKQKLGSWGPCAPVVHMTAATCGEITACLIRVPTEVVKQRMQTGMHQHATSVIKHIITHEGGVFGLYKGFGITIMREIPFALIQFPLYEFGKRCLGRWKSDGQVQSYEAALCGSISGGIAAALTTPLDVIKTRLMLGVDAQGVAYKGPLDTFRRLRIEGNLRMRDHHGHGQGQGSSSAATSLEHAPAHRLGMRIFLSGLGPRVMWISIGGFVFFGAYEQALKITTPFFQRDYEESA